MVQDHFNELAKEKEAKLLKEENKELFGLQSGSVSGRQDKLGILARQFQQKAENQREKEKKDDLVLIFQLLQDQYDAAMADLTDWYGENPLEKMSEKYGIDTEGMSEEEKRKALIKELSKDKYQDDEIAQRDLKKLEEADKAAEAAKRVNYDLETYGRVRTETRDNAINTIEEGSINSNFEFSSLSQDEGLSEKANEEIRSDIDKEHVVAKADWEDMFPS